MAMTEQELIAFGRSHGYNGIHIYVRHKKICEILDTLVRKNGYTNLLNIGSGLGLMEHFMEEVIEITGYDIADDEIAVANDLATQNGRPYTYVHQDINAIESDKKYDMILVSELLEHIPDEAVLLQQLKKMLTPNGVIVITVPHRMQPVNRIRQWQGKELIILDPTHLREYIESEIKEVLVEQNDLNILYEDRAVLYFPGEKWIGKIIPPFSPVRRWILKVFPNLATHFIFVVK